MPRHSKAGSTYSADWQDIAQQCKKAAGWCCIRCGTPHQKGYILTVHHLDMNPANNAWWNLAALCQACHLHIQAKVRLDQPYMFEHSDWFRPYVAGYYASIHGHPTDRQWVLDNIEMLLDYGRLHA